MNEYLLFIDTEGSDLPKKWDQPYSKPNNWPCSVQTSWIVFDKDGNEIKREDHYIKNEHFKISQGSQKIHGITKEFLHKNGEERAVVMQLLHDDLIKFKPLVVGHFMELDYHVLAADFFRTGIPNPIELFGLRVFCTMLTTTKFVHNPHRKFMKLGELYDTLFRAKIEKPHNAIYDAKATADCFFELINRGDLTENEITNLKLDLSIKPKKQTASSWAFFSILLLFILLIAYTL